LKYGNPDNLFELLARKTAAEFSVALGGTPTTQNACTAKGASFARSPRTPLIGQKFREVVDRILPLFEVNMADLAGPCRCFGIPVRTA
jgi:hypothetical protein